VADGLHARTDGFTSLAVVLGAAGVAVGLPWADPVIGLLIAIAILGVLRSAIVQVGARLLDAVDPALVRGARDTILGAGDVLAVDDLRLRWIGHTLHAQADITVAAATPRRGESARRHSPTHHRHHPRQPGRRAHRLARARSVERELPTRAV
jgi:divalent metal cation (Fe/Co/Zn/Cd) transporter